MIREKFRVVTLVLEKKYGFDEFNEWFFAGGSRGLGRSLWKGGDQWLIDGMVVNGSARVVGVIASVVRVFQSGHMYQYAFSMIIGLVVLLTLWLGRS